jgi:hypothetical protein
MNKFSQDEWLSTRNWELAKRDKRLSKKEWTLSGRSTKFLTTAVGSVLELHVKMIEERL